MTVDANLNKQWGELIIRESVRLGIEMFVLSPGSRSTPLALALSVYAPELVVHVDERGAGFFALGHAKATGKPTALICTSGSAGANYFPAVVEAKQSHTPLLILSADRPPELLDTGANQAIDQQPLFPANYLRWSTTLPCPDVAIDPAYVLSTMDEAYRCAMLGGVVHVNCQFREPFFPKHDEAEMALPVHLTAWDKGSAPYTQVLQGAGYVDAKVIESIVSNLSGKSGLIVAGGLDGQQAKEVLALTQHLQWPLFCDVTSQLQLGNDAIENISNYGQLLLDKNLAHPEIILQFGTGIVSKRYGQWVAKHAEIELIVVDNKSVRLDPSHRVNQRLHACVAHTARQLRESLKQPREASTLLQTYAKAQVVVSRNLDGKLDESQGTINEPMIARIISREIAAGTGLFISNSMPIRDMDMFGLSTGPRVCVAANRGASGIDGIVSSAVGFAHGLGAMTTLLIGDLAALHDLNGLALVKKSKQPLIVVVINNDGGGIFSFLPVAQKTDQFETLFATPHGLNFSGAATMFGLSYERSETLDGFESAYRQARQRALTEKTSSIIEVQTSRQENFNLHATLR